MAVILGLYWGPSPWHEDMLGPVGLALGHVGVHSPSTGMYWIPQLLNWDILGPMAVMLEVAGAQVPGTGTCWDPWPLRWGLLGPSPWHLDTLGHSCSALGHTGTHDLVAGMHWDPCAQCWDPLCPQHQDHQPPLAPRGLQSCCFKGPVPFHVRVGLFAERSPLPTAPAPR